MKKGQFRTQFAMKALSAADTFSTEFAGFDLGGRIRRKIVMASPTGISTGGGAQAEQSISLIPDGGGPGLLVAGNANPATMTAELRGFPYLDDTHKMRYRGQSLDISQVRYAAFLEKAKTFFEENGYAVTVITQLPQKRRRGYTGGNAPVAPRSSTMWVLMAIILLLASGIVVFLLTQ